MPTAYFISILFLFYKLSRTISLPKSKEILQMTDQKIEQALLYFKAAASAIEDGVLILNEILGNERAADDFAAYRRTLFQIIKPDNPPSSQTADYKTLQEIQKMLVELNLSLKVRLRKDGRYEIRPTIDGKKVSIYGKTAEELHQKYSAALKNRGKGKIEPKSKIKLFAWLDNWVEIYKKPNVAKQTYENLLRCIRKHLKGTLEDKPINRYTVQELTQALNRIESTRMRQYARGTLRDAFACAITVGHLKENVAANVAPVKHVSKKGKAIPLLELGEMIDRAATELRPDVLHYYFFLLLSGARRDEALEIRGGDFDLKNKIAYIRGTKTQGSNRRIPMFPLIERIFEKYAPTKFERLFTVSKHRANADFAIFRGEMVDAVPHWLRHTFGTVQICINGIPANTVALWMGHADASTTMDIYTHPEDLAPDIYFSGRYSESEKVEILRERYNQIVSKIEKILDLPPI